MSTKGPSRRYGNTRGAHHRGEISEDIGYPWAKDFNKWTLTGHFKNMPRNSVINHRPSLPPKPFILPMRLIEFIIGVSLTSMEQPISTIHGTDAS